MSNLPAGRALHPDLLSVIASRTEFGQWDILNTEASSIEMIEYARKLVGETGAEGGVYLGVRMFNDPDNYRMPLFAYDFDPTREHIPLEESATAVVGPLSKRDAIALAYVYLCICKCFCCI